MGVEAEHEDMNGKKIVRRELRSRFVKNKRGKRCEILRYQGLRSAYFNRFHLVLC